MSNETDFNRPQGIPQGILINTNNEALSSYKKAKKRFNSITELEEKVDHLTKLVEKLLEINNDS